MAILTSNRLRLIKKGNTLWLKAPAGTFSYYHPTQVFTGYGWDTQSASLALIRQPVKTILILGLGGGTAARQCRLLFPNARIVGVEIDKNILDWACRFFNISSLKITTVNASGQSYLQTVNSRFDAIIDDMWMPDPQIPKPLLSEPQWVNLVRSRLKFNGMYAVNLYSRKEMPYEVINAIKQLCPHFPTLREVRPRWGQTTIIAAGRNLHTPQEARVKLREIAGPFLKDIDGLRFLKIAA